MFLHYFLMSLFRFIQLGRVFMLDRVNVLIMTLGFELGPLVSAVASYVAKGLSPNAEIIVLTPTFHDERAERAWRQLQDIFEMLNLRGSGVDLRRVSIDLDEFPKAVLQIKKLFAGFKDKVVHISLTGGMRALILAVFVAYLLTDWHFHPDVTVFLEGKGMALMIPPLSSCLGVKVGKHTLKLMNYMRPGTIYKLGDLCGFLGKDRSTVYRQLKLLMNAGLVKKVDSGFQLTPLGELVSLVA